jgi:hypothetical protein
VLLATGSAMASRFDLWGDGTLQLKLGLVAVLVAGTCAAPRWRRPAMHALEAAIFVVSLVIVWLGPALAHG